MAVTRPGITPESPCAFAVLVANEGSGEAHPIQWRVQPERLECEERSFCRRGMGDEHRRGLPMSRAFLSLSLLVAFLSASAAGDEPSRTGSLAASAQGSKETIPLGPSEARTLSLGDLRADETYRFLVSLESRRIGPDDR